MNDQTSCEEFQRAGLSRRRFLGGLAAAGATAVTTSVFGDAVRQASFAATRGGNVLVVVSFRGGVDGLGLVVPHGEPAYYAARPTIGVPRTELWGQDAMFGFHPDLKPLQWLWDRGELAVVNAVGAPAPTRSHFAAMEEIEDADPGSSLRRGWVNRMVGLDVDVDAVEAVHIGSTVPPAMIEGTTPSIALSALKDVKLAGSQNGWEKRRRKQLTTMWNGVDGPLGQAARSALGASRVLGSVADKFPTPAVKYPGGYPVADLSKALEDTARLIKADLGTEVISVDFGSWDMHADYGTLAYGDMQNMTKAFAGALDAFMRDLGALRSRVTVVTISEFGRRVAENGNRGLDHGWGNVMLLLGGGVRGGRFHGSWPGLGPENEAEGDLKVTTDYRQVLGEIVHKRFPGKDVTQVFPGVPYAPLGVLAG